MLPVPASGAHQSPSVTRGRVLVWPPQPRRLGRTVAAHVNIPLRRLQRTGDAVCGVLAQAAGECRVSIVTVHWIGSSVCQRQAHAPGAARRTQQAVGPRPRLRCLHALSTCWAK